MTTLRHFASPSKSNPWPKSTWWSFHKAAVLPSLLPLLLSPSHPPFSRKGRYRQRRGGRMLFFSGFWPRRPSRNLAQLQLSLPAKKPIQNSTNLLFLPEPQFLCRPLCRLSPTIGTQRYRSSSSNPKRRCTLSRVCGMTPPSIVCTENGSYPKHPHLMG